MQKKPIIEYLLRLVFGEHLINKIKIMQNLNEVFKRIQDRKREQRQIRAIYKDALLSNGEYQKVLGELEDLKAKKKKIEAAIQADFKEELEKLDSIKLNITADNQLLSDISLTSFVAGDKVIVTDENKIEYDPIFTVKFRKR